MLPMNISKTEFVLVYFSLIILKLVLLISPIVINATLQVAKAAPTVNS